MVKKIEEIPAPGTRFTFQYRGKRHLKQGSLFLKEGKTLMENHLGDGSFGNVYKVDVYPVQYYPKFGGYKKMFKAEGSPRALKLFDKNADPSKARLIEKEILEECRVGSSLPHLKTKAVHDDINGSPALISKLLPGQELFYILDDILENLLELSEDMKMEISKKLLDMYKVQVDLQGLIHRDIKPENILIHLNSDDPELRKINLTDYGMAIEKGSEPCIIRGTLQYAAPEVSKAVTMGKKKFQYTSAYDIFSLGKVFYLFWSVDKKHNIKQIPFIYTIVKNMMHPNPEKRPTIDQTIEFFNSNYEIYCNEKKARSAAVCSENRATLFSKPNCISPIENIENTKIASSLPTQFPRYLTR